MINRFTVQIRNWGREAQGRVLTILRGVVLKLFTAVIRDTPVDTGRLRSNWQCSINTADTSVTQDTDRNAPLTRVKGVVDSLTTFKDVTVILANSLPYAYRIEFEGWSHTKSPEGMLRRNAVRFTQLLSQQAR